jgi:hypothetical protein
MNIDHDKSSSHIGVFQNGLRLISRNARLNAFGFSGLARNYGIFSNLGSMRKFNDKRCRAFVGIAWSFSVQKLIDCVIGEALRSPEIISIFI